jgi:hypothetical protein
LRRRAAGGALSPSAPAFAFALALALLLGDEAAALSPTLLEESLLEAAARLRFCASRLARARRARSGSAAGGDMLSSLTPLLGRFGGAPLYP